MSEDSSVQKVGLFDYLNDITSDKKYLMNEMNEKSYDQFMVNRGLGQHLDTILLANEMNRRPGISKLFHHDYLFYSVDAKQRFGKWAKASEMKDEVISYVQKKYSVGRERALEYMIVLGEDEVKLIEKTLKQKGGRK